MQLLDRELQIRPKFIRRLKCKLASLVTQT